MKFTIWEHKVTLRENMSVADKVYEYFLDTYNLVEPRILKKDEKSLQLN